MPSAPGEGNVHGGRAPGVPGTAPEASVQEITMKAEITVQRTGYRVVLKLRWRSDNWRDARADTFRIAAVIEERSKAERWVTIVSDGIEQAGKALLGGYVGVELATEDPAEADRAEALLQQIVDAWETP